MALRERPDVGNDSLLSPGYSGGTASLRSRDSPETCTTPRIRPPFCHYRRGCATAIFASLCRPCPIRPFRISSCRLPPGPALPALPCLVFPMLVQPLRVSPCLPCRAQPVLISPSPVLSCPA